MRRSLEDIAKLVGVSKSTVSRALADSPLVKAETKKRIQDIAGALLYQPNSIARAFATKRSGIIGFCMYKDNAPYFGHTFYGPILDSVIAEAHQDGYHVLLSTTNQQEYTFDEYFMRDSIDGVILGANITVTLVEEFGRRNIPLVALNDVAPTPHNAFIVDDNRGGVSLLMEHLVRAKGHRRIALFTDTLTHVSYFLRYLSYLDALEAYGLTPYQNSALRLPEEKLAVPERVLLSAKLYGMRVPPVRPAPVMSLDGSMQAVEDAVRTLVESGNLPTAIIAICDNMAMKVIRSLLKCGLRVPEDIAVVGYDDITMASHFVPGLTSIAVDRKAIGARAVQELMAQIKDPARESRTVVIPNRLVVRGSG